MSESHFMLEQEGSSEANAAIGLGFSTEFVVARSIRVIAPKRALTLR